MELSYQALFGDFCQIANEEIKQSGLITDSRQREVEAVRRAFGWLKFEALSRAARTEFGAPWAPLEELEAAQFLAMRKFGWPIESVRALRRPDLMFALAEELKQLQLPDEAQSASSNWIRRYGLWEELKEHFGNLQTAD